MRKFLISAALGLAAVTGLYTLDLTTTTNAKVFHNNVATDNGDGCVTPEEIAGIRQEVGGFEKINSYFDAGDVLKLKQGVIKRYEGSKMEDMKWDGIDTYAFVGDDGKVTTLTTIYSKNEAGLECSVGGGVGDLDEWNALLKDAGLTPKASGFHPGHVGKFN